MNSNLELSCSVSSNGEQVALCTPDGVIKFYETITSTLKQEYSSSTHLQAGCTCLSWSKHRKKAPVAIKQKKVKTTNGLETIENELSNLDLIAIGTAQGAVLLYSLSKALLHSQLTTDGHSDKVNDICWDPQFKDSLYSCSDDGFIVEWSLIDAKMRTKWKASKTAITAINVESTSKYLLSASKTITVWDLETKTKFRSLTGHSNDIFKMMFLTNTNVFVSAANNDRILNAWKLDLSSKNTNATSSALASFTINEGPVFIDAVTTATSIATNDDSSKTHALICAVTNKGHLFIYNHQINSEQNTKLKKPIKSLHQVQIETHEGNPLNIFGAFVTNETNERLEHFDQSQTSQLILCLVYGSIIAPVVEKIEFSSLTAPKTVLRRADPSKIDVSLQTQSTKIETPNVSKDLKVLVPGFMAPQTSNNLTSNNVASKRKSIEPSSMSLEERLNVMGIESSNGGETDDMYSKQGQQIPKTDNLLVLLVQGLQSNDAKMLNHVLQHQNEKVVTKTVRMLPTNHVINLVRELNKRLQGHAQSGMGIIKWLKCVLMIHTSYLMSYPDLIDSLGSVYEMMNARTKLFPQLSKLQGKLQLVMTQVSSQAESLQTNDKDGQPLLYYQDSNSEDEQFEEELIPSHSEFDDYLFSDEEEDEDLENENDDLKESK